MRFMYTPVLLVALLGLTLQGGCKRAENGVADQVTSGDPHHADPSAGASSDPGVSAANVAVGASTLHGPIVTPAPAPPSGSKE